MEEDNTGLQSQRTEPGVCRSSMEPVWPNRRHGLRCLESEDVRALQDMLTYLDLTLEAMGEPLGFYSRE